jgi:hypothetical protein
MKCNDGREYLYAAVILTSLTYAAVLILIGLMYEIRLAYLGTSTVTLVAITLIYYAHIRASKKCNST